MTRPLRVFTDAELDAILRRLEKRGEATAADAIRFLRRRKRKPAPRKHT